MDTGKGHLKLVLTMYDVDKLLDKTECRRTRSRGIGSGPEFRLTGRKKIFILAIAPSVKETYKNCCIFCCKGQLNQLDFTFTGDLKVFNIVGGIMSCSSKQPCIYCEASREDGIWQCNAPLRTFNSVKMKYLEWQAASGCKEKAKFYGNCVGSTSCITS